MFRSFTLTRRRLSVSLAGVRSMGSMRWSGIAGTGRKETLTGLNNSLLKMKRDKAPWTGGALFRFIDV